MYHNLHTPCFVLDQGALDANLQCAADAVQTYWKNTIIGYSYKTNSLPWLISYLKSKGVYAEVVSEAEYRLAQAIGYVGDHILFNGPIKPRAIFLEAMQQGSIVNIDSAQELLYLEELSHDRQYSVGIRVNFDLETACPDQTTSGAAGGRFGFSFETGALGEAIEKIQSFPHVKLAGLHMHVSSKTRSLEVYRTLSQMACTVSRQYGLDLEYVDIGGGFFGGLPTKPSFSDYLSVISGELEKQFDQNKVTLILEPGAALVASAFSYICTVTDVKDTKIDRFVVTNGSRIHVDPIMHKESYFYELDTSNESKFPHQTICGFTCMENDRLFELSDQTELSVGDHIILDKVGSYTLCLAPLFIDYFPPIYLQTGKIFSTIREKWTVQEYMARSHLFQEEFT